MPKPMISGIGKKYKSERSTGKNIRAKINKKSSFDF
jgi:hypothetical protein